MANSTKGNLLPNTVNTPLDARARVATLADAANIQNPELGGIFYCVETGKHYKITALASKTIGALEVENAAVGTYEEFGGGGTGNAADVGVADAGEYFTGTNVEAVLQEIGALFGGSIATLEFAVSQADGDESSKTVSVRTVTRNADGTSTYNSEAKTVSYDFSVPADTAEDTESQEG